MAKKKNSHGGAPQSDPISAGEQGAGGEYTTLGGEGMAEYCEKKSVFIGRARPVKTSAEAIEFIRSVRSEHSDARHNVYAYLIASENATRYSDDGEPQGTAGIPLLSVLRSSVVSDAVVTVTRYFGGILLGASGLLRAYSTAASEAVHDAGIVTYVTYDELRLTVSYSDRQRLEVLLHSDGVKLDGCDFGTDVVLSLAVRADRTEFFLRAAADQCSGRARVERLGTRYDA